MMEKTPRIGAFVLETLTTGMYTNPLDTIREFIQNAADSIRKAEDTGVISKGEGKIEVTIDPVKDTLSIKDNGLGIVSARVQDSLLNIGMSDKKIEVDSGFRGIGRLAAIAYCDKLHFHTSAPDENTLSTVELNCGGLRKSISPAMRQVEELANVVEKNSTSNQEKHQSNVHFFEVVMEGISVTTPEFLEGQALERYLSQVAPVTFDAQRFFYATKISKWMKSYGLSLPVVTLVIKTPQGERQVFKPYKTHYKTQDDKFDFEVKGIEFYPEAPSPDIAFWIWYGKTDLLGMVNDDRVAGFRLRKNNIQIGLPERVSELFGKVSESNYRFNAWYIGEVHVLETGIIPNARRDGFEDNQEWHRVKEDLMTFIRARCADARNSSQLRNISTVKVVKAAEKVVAEANTRLNTGFVSSNQRENILARLAKEEERSKKVFEIRQNKEPQEAEKIQPVIDNLKRVREAIEQKDHYAVTKLRSNLDRKQRKIISEILAILYEVLPKAEYEKASKAILGKFSLND